MTAPIGGPTGGCDFWQVQPGGTGYTYVGRADHNAGGGDCDLATSAQVPAAPGGMGHDVVFASSLIGAVVSGENITTTSSLDGGTTFAANPNSQPIPADDRMWNTAGAASNPLDFYMTFRQVPGLGSLIVEHSVDGGLSFVPVAGNPVVQSAGFEGNIVSSSDGQSLYIIYLDSTGSTHLAASHNAGTSWTLSLIKSGSFGSIFPSIALDPNNSTLYAVFTDGGTIHFDSAASDAGPWTDQTVPVLDGTKSNVFPWVVSGAPGQADVVWYGTPDSPETTSSQWNVYFARYTNSLANPVETKVSTTPNHTGFICTSGTGCSGTAGTSGDRTMLDFFQVADGADGRAHIAWTKDNPGNANEPTVIMYAEEVAPGAGVPEAPMAAVLLVPGLVVIGFVARRWQRSRPLE